MGLITSGLGAVGSSALDFLSTGLGNMWSAHTNYGYSKRMARFNAELSKELAEYSKDLDRRQTEWYLTNNYKLARQGLTAAGYNPILAVNSAGGSPMSVDMPSVGGSVSGAGGKSVNVIEGLARIGLLKQTEAQTDYLKEQADYIDNKKSLDTAETASRIRLNDAQAGLTDKRSLSEGWNVKTLSRAEAKGMGVNFLNMLGINLRDNNQETFLIAYNPITGELRNLGNTSYGSLGSTGEVNNAADVPKYVAPSLKYEFTPEPFELKPEYRK